MDRRADGATGSSRREFVVRAGIGTLAAAVASAPAIGAEASAPIAGGGPIQGPIWIDALSGLAGLAEAPVIETSALEALAASSLSMFSITVAITVGPPGTPNFTYEEAVADLGRWQGRFARYPDKLVHVTRADDILEAKRLGRTAVMLNFQNTAHLRGDLRNLELFHSLGVRQIQLTYNSLNDVGCGCTERTDGGLSYFGIDAIARMNELGILVDLSHSNERTALDAIAVARKPLAITHTNCRALRDHPRCKTDEEIRKVAAIGGVVGMTTYGTFVGARAPVTLDDFIRHVEHAVKIAGMDHVGIGSDTAIQPVDYPKSEAEFNEHARSPSNFRPMPDVKWNDQILALDGPSKFRTIADALKRRGFASRDIDKILGGNFLRLYREVIG